MPGISLIDLDLSNNKLDGKCLTMLCDTMKIHCTLMHLNLANNLIKNKGLENLSKYLCSKKCKLTELSLHGNRIDG